LCLGLEQIILKCLARLTILQLSQIFFTADLIFIKTLILHYAKEKQGKDPYFPILLLFRNCVYYNTPLLKK